MASPIFTQSTAMAAFLTFLLNPLVMFAPVLYLSMELLAVRRARPSVRAVLVSA